VIAFGCSIISPEAYERWAAAGIRLAGEPDSTVFALQAAGSIFRSYNLILDQAAARDDLEALVLVHEDTEIVDPCLGSKLREALRDSEVGVIGCVGAIGARSIAWWDRSTTVGSYVHRYQELGGGEVRAFASGRATRPVVEVDTVDGLLMALSPWAVRNIRFDEALGPHFGYDFDFCQQVRAAGRKVVTADLNVAHHHSLALVGDSEPWIAAHMRAAEKWDRRETESKDDSDWQQRARRAEAEAVVARLTAAATLLQADARTAAHARRLEQVTGTASWRVTAPLRRINAWRKARRRA
jgi:GT2 family glycosyltransferase